MTAPEWRLSPPWPALEGDLPASCWEWLPWDWDRPRKRSGRVMFPHQTTGADYLLENWGGALFMGMRTGKSLTLADAVIRGGIWPHLIVCPVSVMATWENEFLEEGLEPHEIQLVRGDARGDQLTRPGALVTVVNFEVLRKTHALRIRDRLPEALELPRWAGVTVDESYRIANPEASATAEILRSPRTPAQFRAILSGAPASESGLNLASQFLFLDGEFFGCSSVVDYYGKHCRMDLRSRRWIPERSSHLQEIRDQVQARAFCVQMEDLNLGVDKVFQVWNVEPTKAQEEALQWCVLANTYTAADDHGRTVTRLLEPLVRSTFMAKASAGIHPLTDEVIGDGKARMVRDWLVEHADQSALILSRFTIPVGVCLGLLVAAGIPAEAITGATPPAERERIRRDFQAGKLRAVVGQVKTVKMGMDFSAADVLFYLSNSYSQDDRTQSEDRGNHTKKTGVLQIIDLCTKGGNDRKLVSLLTQKKAVSRSYIEETLGRWAEELRRA